MVRTASLKNLTLIVYIFISGEAQDWRTFSRQSCKLRMPTEFGSSAINSAFVEVLLELASFLRLV